MEIRSGERLEKCNGDKAGVKWGREVPRAESSAVPPVFRLSAHQGQAASLSSLAYFLARHLSHKLSKSFPHQETQASYWETPKPVLQPDSIML